MMNQPVRTNVSDFIKTTMGSQFVIPVYQRNYTWNPENETARFLDDFEDLLSKKTSHHFLGILIYIESEIAATFKQIQIVDGQQRLTTSFIFLLCLKRVALEQHIKEVAGMIDDYYLYNRHAIEDAKLRLKPTVSDDDVYAKLVYGSYKDLTKKDKETTVYRNYEAIYHRILQFSEKYSLYEVLDGLSKFDLLVFPLSQDDNAQQIFESINSTGAPLTSADLIRNYILMNDTNEVQERYYRLYWQPLETNLSEPRRLEDFFRAYLACKTYSLMNRRDVYDGFKDYWNHNTDNREDKLRDVNRYCRYYVSLYNTPYDDDEIENALKDFRKSESRLPAPFLMEMFNLYEEGEIDKTTLINQIRLIDTYLTRRAICENDTGMLNRYFPQLLRSVMNRYKKHHQNIHEITKVFLVNYNRSKPLAMPTDRQIKTQLREVNAYSLMIIRAILERIEHYGASAEVDTSNLNIEHIMPQHPNAYWKKVANAKDEDEYAYYANLIGNLTLCAEYDNTKMGNQDFEFKKQVLSKTLHIRLNTEILKKTSWTPQDILERTDALARKIIEIYPYQGGQRLSQDTKDDDIIVLSAPTVNAKAIYQNAQSIEILAGSTMKAYRRQEMKSMQDLYHKMIALGVLVEDEEGRVQFEKNYRFHDLNIAAQFLLHRGGDNTGAWTNEDGSALEIKEEKKKVAPKPRPTPSKETVRKPKPRRTAAPRKSSESKPKVEKRKITRQTQIKKESSPKPKRGNIISRILKGIN